GVVTTSEESGGGQPITTATYEIILERVYQSLTSFTARNYIKQFMDQNQVQMVGTSGTVTTLAAIQLKLERYDRRIIDGLLLETADLQNVINGLLEMTYDERLQHPCVGTGRADLVVVGSAILQGICRSCPVSSLRVADRGVREGILLELMRVLE
ncbi:MAG: Ppx/GppA family phosphatase, partial [Alphaproteobacteria bacterium]